MGNTDEGMRRYVNETMNQMKKDGFGIDNKIIDNLKKDAATPEEQAQIYKELTNFSEGSIESPAAGLVMGEDGKLRPPTRQEVEATMKRQKESIEAWKRQNGIASATGINFKRKSIDPKFDAAFSNVSETFESIMPDIERSTVNAEPPQEKDLSVERVNTGRDVFPVQKSKEQEFAEIFENPDEVFE